MVEDTIEKAKQGDRAAVDKLMQWYCGGLTTTIKKKGEPPRIVNREPSIDDRILRYFGECFGMMLKGVSVERAMNVKNKEGAPKADNKVRDIDIALEADRLITENDKLIETRRKRRATKGKLYEQAGEPHNVGFHSVKKIHAKHGELASRVNAISIDSLLSEGEDEGE
jgi:hypothetical protein